MRRTRTGTRDKKVPSAAARMRRFRTRNRKAGLREARRWVPVNLPGTVPFSDHRLHDIRSLAMHSLIARKLLRDPGLLSVARSNLARWAKRRALAPAYLDEWRRILRRPLQHIVALITDPSEEATRLRQSSPFAGVLPDKERQRIFDAFRA